MNAFPRTALISCLLLSACTDTETAGPVQTNPGGDCVTTADCGDGLLCIAEVCQDPNAPPEPDPGPEAQPEPDPQPNPNPAPTPDPEPDDPPEGDCLSGQDLDRDGIDDGEEGEGDPDGDGLVNCMDGDSDNDGLSDAEEALIGADPTSQDSDEDGASDLLELAAGTDLRDRQDRPDQKTFLALIEPGADTVTARFTFSSRVQRGDIYFLMDTSTTMLGEINNLKQTIVSTIIPRIRDTLDDVQFGVGHFDDFPVSPYGNNPAFRAYENLQDITSDDQRVVQAINRLQTCCLQGDGFTFPESQTVALWGLATTEGLGSFIPPRGICQNKGTGYPCFRPDALPIVVLVTDADFHNGPGGSNLYTGITPTPPSYDQAMAELSRLGAKVIGIFSGERGLRPHTEETVRRSGAVTSDDSPLIYEVNSNGTGLDLNIVSAFEELTGNVRRDVSVAAEDPDDQDDVDPRPLLLRATPISADPPQGIVATDANRFLGVIPGTELTFEVELTRGDNQPEPADGEHIVVRLLLRVLGDGAVLLDQRTVYLVIARQGATIDLEGP